MSEFVNYKSRSVSLPPGCKDLIDLLKPAPTESLFAEAKSVWTAAGMRKAGFEAAGLDHVGRYVARLVKESSGVSVLMISIPKRSSRVLLFRKRGGGGVHLILSAEH